MAENWNKCEKYKAGKIFIYAKLYKIYKNRLTQKRKTDMLVIQKHDNRLTCKVFKDEKVNDGLEEEK